MTPEQKAEAIRLAHVFINGVMSGQIKHYGIFATDENGDCSHVIYAPDESRSCDDEARCIWRHSSTARH